MDALGIFELGAKAGRAYVRAIRQAYRDAKAGESDYYASRLGRVEEDEEVLEPGDAWVFEAEPMARYTPDPRMECESIDAAEPAAALPKRCWAGKPNDAPNVKTFCDGLAGHDGAHNHGGYEFWTNLQASDTPPPVPSSSAGRGVGSPGVSAGAEESAPPGKRPTPGEFAAVAVREVLAAHHPWEGAGGIECSPESADFEHPYSADHLLHFADKYDWREHVATEVQRRIDAAVGATPTPKPAQAEAASTFEQHRKTK